MLRSNAATCRHEKPESSMRSENWYTSCSHWRRGGIGFAAYGSFRERNALITSPPLTFAPNGKSGPRAAFSLGAAATVPPDSASADQIFLQWCRHPWASANCLFFGHICPFFHQLLRIFSNRGEGLRNSSQTCCYLKIGLLELVQKKLTTTRCCGFLGWGRQGEPPLGRIKLITQGVSYAVGHGYP